MYIDIFWGYVFLRKRMFLEGVLGLFRFLSRFRCRVDVVVE